MEGGTGRPRKRHDFLICAPSPEAPRGSEVDRLLAENARLRAELVQARADAAARQVKVDRLQARVGELEVALEEARWAAKRQAAPFSRNRPKARPRPGGRKPGAAHGAKAHRLAPAPERVDEVVAVALPGCCPQCGGEVVVDTVAWQFQEELVCVRARMRRYDLQLGHCTACMRAVRGRHPEQTSQALGAAGTMLGPRAIAVAAWLHVGLGVPVAKVAMILKELGGISRTPGGLQQALHRLAGHAGSTQQALLGTLRGSAAVSADETGWRVAGRKAWLWAYVGDHASVYDIAGGRGYDQAAAILGGDFAGVLERDG